MRRPMINRAELQFIYSHEDEKGKALCEMIADEYQKAGQPLNAIFTRVSSNGQDYYGVIRLTKMQAIIAETAFVTNLQDVERFNDNTFCKNIAEAMSRGVCRYFGLPYKEESGGEKKMYYRVRKSWNDDASQLGAYSDIENARLVADENPGYYVFDDKGKTVYPEKPAACEIKLAELQSKYDKLAAENTALKNKIAKAAELLGS